MRRMAFFSLTLDYLIPEDVCVASICDQRLLSPVHMFSVLADNRSILITDALDNASGLTR